MATGCYAPQYLPASFKGIAFEAMDAGSEHGRRGAVGEFPFGEDTAYADLGRRNATYSIKARFVENSHIADSAALIEAVESPGSGILVHPTRGVINVACKSIKIKDDMLEEQGVTYADLEFIEANDWPGGISFGGGILGLAADALLLAASVRFLDNYKPLQTPYHRRAAVLSQAASSIGVIKNEFAKANPRSADARVIRAISDFDLITSNETLLLDGATVQTALANGALAIARTLSGAAKLNAFRRIANSATSSIGGTSGDAVASYVRHLAGAYLGQVAAEKQFATIDEALRYMDVAYSVLSSEASISYALCDNELFLELRKYTTTMQTVVYNKAYSLPGIVTYDFNAGVHSLVAAYHIYGDAKRHREVEASNVIGPNGKINNLVVGVG